MQGRRRMTHTSPVHVDSGRLPPSNAVLGAGWCAVIPLIVLTYHVLLSLVVPKLLGPISIFTTWYQAACWFPVVVIATIVGAAVVLRKCRWFLGIAVLAATCLLSGGHSVLVQLAHAYGVT